MLYLSLAVILLGILIFAYSIIVDAKKRHDELPGRGSARDAASSPGSSGGSAANRNHRNSSDVQVPKGEKNKQAIMDDSRKEHRPPGRRAAGPQSEKQAILYVDSSHVIDYANQSGSIDSSLEGYKNIKRVGSGYLAIEKGGVTFYMGKKLYRFDFHRIRDVKSGSGHLAIFLKGSDAVRLFIIESGSAIITAVSDAYREYQRSSA